MEEQTNKEKIILILKESIKFGRESLFLYDFMSEKHKEVIWIKAISTTMEEKIKLFQNIDETSYIFKTIFDCAKIALRKLQEDECYNYYSAELIMKFNLLENIFKQKLRPIGIRIIEQVEKRETLNEFLEGKKEIPEEFKTGKYISPSETGKKLQSKIKRKREIISALSENQFKD